MHHFKMMYYGLIYSFCLFLLSKSVVSDFHASSGPWVTPTKGEPWPLPTSRTLGTGFFHLRPSIFNIDINIICDILEDAKERYSKIILREARIGRKAMVERNDKLDHNNPDYKGTLSSLHIHVKGECEKMPYLHMNEQYQLEVTDETANLYAQTIWGTLRGIETFSQLLIPSGDGANLAIKNQTIMDDPKLPHRGLLLDTSRHFIPVDDIMLTLDAMCYNKLNVFHWHIVDDNSFPYKSLVYPELSKLGAWHPTMIYTPDDVNKIIEYARLRGIRVLPEFDSPGHVASWGLSHPELLTACYTAGKIDGRLGPINPTYSGIWPFLRTFLTEAINLFKDKYIHLGGDEVPFDCWASNPTILSYMQQHEMGNDFTKLESEYIVELLKIPTSHNITTILWQEVFDNGVALMNDTVIHVWTGNWSDKLSKVTKAGYPVLLSACWYLDHIAGGSDWLKYYLCDPMDFDGSQNVQNLMLGGEACMWGEFVDRNNIHPRIWPRASAVAERLWSQNSDTVPNASRRLEEHSCRMNRRSIPSQPANGPSFCVV